MSIQPGKSSSTSSYSNNDNESFDNITDALNNLRKAPDRDDELYRLYSSIVERYIKHCNENGVSIVRADLDREFYANLEEVNFWEQVAEIEGGESGSCNQKDNGRDKPELTNGQSEFLYDLLFPHQTPNFYDDLWAYFLSISTQLASSSGSNSTLPPPPTPNLKRAAAPEPQKHQIKRYAKYIDSGRERDISVESFDWDQVEGPERAERFRTHLEERKKRKTKTVVRNNNGVFLYSEVLVDDEDGDGEESSSEEEEDRRPPTLYAWQMEQHDRRERVRAEQIRRKDERERREMEEAAAMTSSSEEEDEDDEMDFEMDDGREGEELEAPSEQDDSDSEESGEQFAETNKKLAELHGQFQREAAALTGVRSMRRLEQGVMFLARIVGEAVELVGDLPE